MKWRKAIALTVGIFGNLWIWKIVNFNLVIALLLVVATLALYKNLRYLFITLLAVILFFQYKTTNIQSLTNLTNDQQRVQEIRLKAYPYSDRQIGLWLEGKKEVIALGRIRKNFFENLDINQYFFASHPRERVGITEFTKFSYLLLPFFLLGLYKLIKKSASWTILTFLAPMILLAVTGNQNPIGPFSLFPILSLAIIYGIEKI